VRASIPWPLKAAVGDVDDALALTDPNTVLATITDVLNVPALSAVPVEAGPSWATIFLPRSSLLRPGSGSQLARGALAPAALVHPCLSTVPLFVEDDSLGPLLR